MQTSSVLVKYLQIFVWFAAIHGVLGKLTDYDITCKDENGQNVDWFYLYKLPGQFKESLTQKNSRYVYITSASPNQQWELSKFTLNESSSMAGQTLAQAYYDRTNDVQDRLLIAYNDEPPIGHSNDRKGHTKGVLVADAKSGFWLVHSVPLYPNITSKTFACDAQTQFKLFFNQIKINDNAFTGNARDYYYPSTGMIYGQSFLCLSLDAKQIDVVGQQLIYNEVEIYDKQLTQTLSAIYPNIERLIRGEHITDAPYWNLADLKTLGRQRFKSFAKSSKFAKELYEDWVAPMLNTNLYVETWRKGPGNFPSNCSQSTKVWNISKVKIDSYAFPTTDDHSKWAVGDKDSAWICVGDINRAMRQTQRGGGTVCQQFEPIASKYRELMADFQACTS